MFTAAGGQAPASGGHVEGAEPGERQGEEQKRMARG